MDELVDGFSWEWEARNLQEGYRWLVIRLYQLANGDNDTKETVSKMVDASISAFAERVGVDLDEVRLK
jgi:hypothetical protein